jgi:hypothetical protein
METPRSQRALFLPISTQHLPGLWVDPVRQQTRRADHTLIRIRVGGWGKRPTSGYFGPATILNLYRIAHSESTVDRGGELI